jgi:orotate phosphoribosyltransferase
MFNRPFSEMRRELQLLLTRQGFIESRQDGPLLDRRGSRLPWIYYGGEITLTRQGLELMSAALLDRLSTFESRQIATYGISAISLLSACILRAPYELSGLVVRRERKPYGAARQIDGPLNRCRPVVIVDESISSGKSASEAIAALEAQDLEIEGVICVIEFTGYGAAESLRSRGYRVETVYNVWKDLRPAKPAPPDPAVIDGELGIWSTEPVPDGMPPADVVHYVCRYFWDTGKLPVPPSALDAVYDARGGTYVSVRRSAGGDRLVRAGFRRDHHTSYRSAGHDVVVATYRALQSLPPGTSAELNSLKFAVSFLGEPEAIRAAQIDHQHYALIVRGIGPLDRIGFALPNAPHYDDDLEQYGYARTVAACFGLHEPHALYRQAVVRNVQSGHVWPPYGAARPAEEWFESTVFAGWLAAVVRDQLRKALNPTSLDGVEAPPEPREDVFGAAITIYWNGLAGCAFSMVGDLDRALREATAAAVRDSRFGADWKSVLPGAMTVVVSLLIRKRSLGCMSLERLPLFYRLGKDTLQVSGYGKGGIVLGYFAVHQSVGHREYQDQSLRKAALTAQRADWTSYETLSWLVTPDQTARMRQGFPVRPGKPLGREDCVSLMTEMAGFVLRNLSDDGLPFYSISPWSGTRTPHGTATRILIAISGILEAAPLMGDGFAAAGATLLNRFIDGRGVRIPREDLLWDRGSDAQLLSYLAVARPRDACVGLAAALVARLRRLIHPNGAIFSGTSRMKADALLGIDLSSILDFYRRRFKLSYPWGMVWWHGQAWCALSRTDHAYGSFAFELIDWALERQNALTGAFMIHDLEPTRSSFLTACVLEAVADAWALALRLNDVDRAQRYSAAWRRGIAFIERLTLRHGDAFFSASAEMGLGGVRATVVSTELRIDYTGHALLALAKGAKVAFATQPLQGEGAPHIR